VPALQAGSSSEKQVWLPATFSYAISHSFVACGEEETGQMLPFLFHSFPLFFHCMLLFRV
ncbi:MAG: hypothetical protein IJL96_00785, partial [Clostridia bacterium]|nr:hypothetical protein [Clostridia bacterium]